MISRLKDLVALTNVLLANNESLRVQTLRNMHDSLVASGNMQIHLDCVC
jgi:hypothetical protein